MFGEVAVETASITESQQLRWTAGSVPARFYSKSTISSLRLEVCSIFNCIFFRGRSRGTERLSRTPEVTARGAEPWSTGVVQLLSGGRSGHGARSSLTEEALAWSVVRRLAPPARSQFSPGLLNRPDLGSPRPPPRCLGPGQSERAHDRPLPSTGLALGGDSKSRCLGVFQMPFTEPHQRPNSFPPPFICLCHRKMPTESYFAFPPSILCFL